MLKRRVSKISGLTVLELIAVAVFILVAASVIKVSAGDFQAKYRNSSRLSDINEIAEALRSYHSINKKYPPISRETVISGSDELSVALRGELTLNNTPVDPLYPTHAYTYLSDSGGKEYTLGFCLEKKMEDGYKANCENTLKSGDAPLK